MPKARFPTRRSGRPAAILVTGDVEFFVEEAAARTREILASTTPRSCGSRTTPRSRSVSDALLNRSLFSPQPHRGARHLAAPRHGGAGPAADEGASRRGRRASAGRRSGRRGCSSRRSTCRSGQPEETAEAAAREGPTQGRSGAAGRDLQGDAGGEGGRRRRPALGPAGRCSSGTENDGTVALMTAVSPPAGVDLVREIADRGLVLETTVGDDAEPALRRLARGPRERAGGRSGARSGAASPGPDGLPGGAVRDGAREAPRVGGQGRPDPGHRHRGERRGRILRGRLCLLRLDRPP